MLLPLLAPALALAAADAPPPQCDLSPLPPGAYEAHLVTIAPGGEPFSYIGHAALWMRDPERKIEHFLEFGAIDSRSQEPLSALLLGELRCWWRVERLENQLLYFEAADRRATAWRLNLPPAAEDRFFAAMYGTAKTAGEISAPFHWQRQSCATELRDMLDEATEGALAAQLQPAPAPLTARGEVLRHLGRVGWAWLAWHALAGPDTDRPLSRWEAAFAPVRLSEAAAEITLPWPSGEQRPMLDPPCVLHPGTDRWPPPAPPQRAPLLWGVGLALGGLIGAGPRRLAGGLLVAYGLLAGLLGVAGVSLWGLSALEAYAGNRTLLVLSPLSLLLVPLGARLVRGRPQPPRARLLAAALAALGLLGLALALVGPQPNLDLVGIGLPTLLAAAWRLRNKPPS